MRLTFRFFVSNINFNKKEVIVAMKELLERVLEFLSQMPNYSDIKINRKNRSRDYVYQSLNAISLSEEISVTRLIRVIDYCEGLLGKCRVYNFEFAKTLVELIRLAWTEIMKQPLPDTCDSLLAASLMVLRHVTPNPSLIEDFLKKSMYRIYYNSDELNGRSIQVAFSFVQVKWENSLMKVVITSSNRIIEVSCTESEGPRLRFISSATNDEIPE